MRSEATPAATRVGQELQVMRQQTRWFIEDAATMIQLTPHTEVKTDAGGKVRSAGLPRKPQMFRILPLSRSVATSPTSGLDFNLGTTNDGINRTSEFKIMGEWNAVLERGDTFELDGDEYEVFEVTPARLTPYKRIANCRGVPSGS